MPPRRPGGKYRGLVRRAKGEATIAKEAEAERRRKLQEFLSRMEEKRQQEAMPDANLQSKKEQELEVRKQRIMNMLVGGTKGNLKKFFKSWVVGKAMVQKERLLRAREQAWRASCNFCVDYNCPGQCGSFRRLQDNVHILPYDYTQSTILARETGVIGVGEQWTGTEEEVDALGGRDALASLVKSFSHADLNNRRRQASTRWSDEAKAPWLESMKPQVVSHHKSGGRVLLDTTSMRTVKADITADRGRHPLDPSPYANGRPMPMGTFKAPLSPLGTEGAMRASPSRRSHGSVTSPHAVDITSPSGRRMSAVQSVGSVDQTPASHQRSMGSLRSGSDDWGETRAFDRRPTGQSLTRAQSNISVTFAQIPSDARDY